MRHFLVDPLPTEVAVGGRQVAVRWDFRIGMLFDALLWDRRLPPRMKVAQGLRLYYAPGAGLEDADAAFEACCWFFACGRARGEEGARAARPVRVVDYDRDGPLIFAAFWEQYGVDLQAVEALHWWKFRAMLDGLRAEHEIARRMAVRGVRLADIGDREERTRLARLKARYRLEG